MDHPDEIKYTLLCSSTCNLLGLRVVKETKDFSFAAQSAGGAAALVTDWLNISLVEDVLSYDVLFLNLPDRKKNVAEEQKCCYYPAFSNLVSEKIVRKRLLFLCDESKKYCTSLLFAGLLQNSVDLVMALHS